MNMKIQMIRKNKKKQNRDIKKLGKDIYDFDWKQEKYIYMYLCRKRLPKKVREKMGSCLKFETHKEWERYINHKYEDFSKEELLEFSYFLNQNMRNIKPAHEYLNIVTPVMVTLVFDTFLKIIYEIKNIPIDSFVEFLVEIIFIIFFWVVVQKLINKISKCIWDNTDGEYFYLDYKEIIDSMIEKRYS